MGRGTPGLEPRPTAGLECEPGSLPNLEVPVFWNQHFLEQSLWPCKDPACVEGRLEFRGGVPAYEPTRPILLSSRCDSSGCKEH